MPGKRERTRDGDAIFFIVGPIVTDQCGGGGAPLRRRRLPSRRRRNIGGRCVSAEEVAQRFPDAVRAARRLRDVFGAVRLTYACNAQGDELGHRASVRTEISAELWARILADMGRRRR